MGVACRGLIAVTVCPVQITLSQVGSSGHFMCTSCGARSCLGQILVGILEVVNDDLHDLVVRTLTTSLDGCIVHALGNERHLVPHLLQFIIEMCTEEAHLSSELPVSSSIFGFVQRLDGAVTPFPLLTGIGFRVVYR